jgi:hypothetical protein
MIALRTHEGASKETQQRLWIAAYAAAVQGISNDTMQSVDVNKFASAVADQAVREFENRLNPNADMIK